MSTFKRDDIYIYKRSPVKEITLVTLVVERSDFEEVV